MTRRPQAIALALLSLASACGSPPRAPSTPALDLSGVRPQPPAQRLRVIARVDDRYRQIPAYERRVGDRMDAVADHMAVRFGIALDLIRIEPWSPSPPAGVTDAEGLLSALERAGQPIPGARGLSQGAELIVGFTALPPPQRPTMSELAHGRYAGRFLVVRSLTTLFPPDRPEALHQAETLALLHGLGRIFGAVPTCGDTVMADRPALVSTPGSGGELAREGWHPLNLALVRLHARLDLTARDGLVPRPIAARALELLESAPSVERCAGDRIRRRRDLLLSVMRADRGPAEPSAHPIEAAPRPDPPAVGQGRAALAAGDAARAYKLCAPAAAENPSGAGARCAGLAARTLGRSDDAIRFLRAHLAHHAPEGEVVISLARLLGRSGDDAAARALLLGFLQANPQDTEARLNLGIAHARLGDYEGAREAWLAVLAADPDNADARELLEGLPAP